MTKKALKKLTSVLGLVVKINVSRLLSDTKDCTTIANKTIA